MKCVICGIETNSIEEAIDQIWIPYFHESQTEHGPICPECSEVLLEMDDDGEMYLKGQFKGKIVYQMTSRQEVSVEKIITNIFIQNSLQSMLN